MAEEYIIGSNAQFNENVDILGKLNLFDSINQVEKFVLNLDSKEKLRITSDSISLFQDLDVNGHTNLDNVSIAGVTTFGNNINASGISRFEIASIENALLDGSIEHTGDIDTKISFDTDTIKFDTAGSERLRITSQGNIGINSSIPAATLDIHDVGSTGPNLLLRGGSQTEGDIVVPDGEALQIGHWNYGSNTFSERYRMKSNGHLFINTTTNPLGNAEALINMRVDDGEDGVNIRHDMSGHCINIWRSNGNGSVLEFYRSDGSQGASVGRINLTTTSTAYATSSDYRLKENAVGITSAITRLKTLKPYRFNFINDPTKTVDGFFAHEVTAVPEAITGTKDEVDSDNNPVYQGIDQSKLVPLLTAALQEAVAKIETLEAKVAALESA